jgi:hypothetical protein
MQSAKSKLLEIEPNREVSGLDKLIAQKWIIYAGSGIFLLAFVSGLLAHNSLKEHVVNPELSDNKGKTEISEAPPEKSQAMALADSGIVKPDIKVVDSIQSPKNDSVTVKVAAAVPPSLPTKAQIKANYPFFRGPEGTGVASQKNTPVEWNGSAGKNIIWKVKIPKPGYS